MKDVKVYYKDGVEVRENVYSMGFAYYQPCKVCGWRTQKYFENSVAGIVKCDQCGNPVIYNYIVTLDPKEEVYV